MSDSFISYSHKDIDFVYKLKDELIASGREFKGDWDILPTEEWRKATYTGIEEADNFICVLSPEFFASEMCNVEVQYAIKCKKRLVPIVLREVKYDEVHQVYPGLAETQWIKFQDTDKWEVFIRVLKEALDTDLDYSHQATRLLIRAKEWETHGRDRAYLLRGADLVKAEQWLTTSVGIYLGGATPLQREFISTSRHAKASFPGYIQQFFTRPIQEVPLRDIPRVQPTTPQVPQQIWQYDIALSYASEDRQQVEALANALRRRKVKVFFDQYKKSVLWGQNLATYLADVYQNQARYCILFLSQHYVRKRWTQHEWQAVQARILNEQGAVYVLPIRLDQAELPGLFPTVAYLDWQQETTETIADLIVQKIKGEEE